MVTCSVCQCVCAGVECRIRADVYADGRTVYVQTCEHCHEKDARYIEGEGGRAQDWQELPVVQSEKEVSLNDIIRRQGLKKTLEQLAEICFDRTETAVEQEQNKSARRWHRLGNQLLDAADTVGPRVRPFVRA